MTKEEILQILEAIIDRDKADGCKLCAYQNKDEWEMPCVDCKRNHKDYWRHE